MLIVLVLLYFLLACLAGWLLLFPAGRAALLLSMANLGLRFDHRLRGFGRAGAGRAQALNRGAQAALAYRWRRAKRRRWLLAAAATLVCLPPLLAWLAGDGRMLAGYDDDGREINAEVAELLKGEQLVPPPSPPPLVFTALEVTQWRPLLGPASRDWLLLDIDFRQRLLLVFKIMREHGYDMALLEGYRSPQRQTMLAAAGPHVTSAQAFQSYHQYGLAADCAFLRDGRLRISERDPWAMRGYQLYGEAAESVGLNWGGRWARMDLGHTELRPRKGGKK